MFIAPPGKGGIELYVEELKRFKTWVKGAEQKKRAVQMSRIWLANLERMEKNLQLTPDEVARIRSELGIPSL